MDVHSTNYTLCAMEPVFGADDRIYANIQVAPDYKNILMFIEKVKQKLDPYDTYDVECGYEAGCLGIYLVQSAYFRRCQMRNLGPYYDAYPTRKED